MEGGGVTMSEEFYILLPRNPILLDNLSITLNLRMLEIWPEYKAARERLYGTNRFSRLWMKWVYPAIKPAQYNNLELQFRSKLLELQCETLNAVIERGKGEIKKSP